jgi:hypothetical protein
MTTAIVSYGLASPSGATAREHVFFLRAGAPPWPSPFVLASGGGFYVAAAPWLQDWSQVSKRVLGLARLAIQDACSGVTLPPRLGLLFSAPRPRLGITSEELHGLASTLALEVRAWALELSPDAGVAVTLARAERLLSSGLDAVLVVGADSWVTARDVTARAQDATGPWLFDEPVPGEGAAALLLTTGGALGATAPLATLDYKAHAIGASHDDNEELIDAAAMTELLWRIPPFERGLIAYGQDRVDLLRSREWEWSKARCAARLAHLRDGECLESQIGRVGASAGLMVLVFGLAFERHTSPNASTFLSWEITRGGVRSVVRATVVEVAAFRPLNATPHPRGVQLDAAAPMPGVDAFTQAEVDALLSDQLPALAAMAPVTANDVDAADGELEAESPAVRFDPKRARVLELREARAEVVAHCVQTLAMLLRDRTTEPLGTLAETERRLLCQLDAIVASGPGARNDVLAWWRDHAGAWDCGAATLAVCAFAGDDTSRAVLEVLETIVATDAHVDCIAEALAVSAAFAPRWYERLQGSSAAIARAVAVRVGPAEKTLVLRALHDESSLVVRAGLRALALLPRVSGRAIERAHDLAIGEDQQTAYQALRALLIHGDVASAAAFSQGRYDASVGELGFDLLPLTGNLDDLHRLRTRFGTRIEAPVRIDALARFGAPAVIPILCTALVDERLGESAATGLRTMLGDLVHPREERQRAAWLSAIASIELSARQRYRRGRPWSAEVIEEELGITSTLSRIDYARRLDELSARLTLGSPPTLIEFGRGGWMEARAFASRGRDKLSQ